MIGIIVSGHGNFATGVESGIELVAGHAENVRFFDFAEGKSSEDADLFYKKAIDSFDETVNEIVILTDLAGGTPFNRAVTMSLGYDNVHVLSGANMAMLLSAVLGRGEFENDIDGFINHLVEEGKNGVNVFTLK